MDSGNSLDLVTPDTRRTYRQILLNAASLFGAYAIPRALTFAAVVLAARTLGTASFGQYATAAAFAVVLSVVATLGMSLLLIREISRDPSRAAAWLKASHVVKTVANLLMLALVYVLATAVFDYPSHVLSAAMLLAIAYAVGAYAENYSAYFQALERMHVWTQASAIYGFVTGLAGSIIVINTRSVTWFCLAPVFGQLMSVAWMAWQARGAPACRMSIADLTTLGRALRPFGVSFLVLTVYYKIDVLILERLRDTVDAGVYTAAYKFVDIVHALILVVVGAVYPRLARLAGSHSEQDHPAVMFAEAGWLILVPVAGAVAILRTEIVQLTFGMQYAEAALPLGVLAAAVPFLAFSLLASYVLSAEHRVWRVAGAYGVALILNVALNLVFVPRFGPTGAALAKLGSEIGLASVFLLALRSTVWPAVSWRVIAAAAALTTLAVLLERSSSPPTWTLIAWLAAVITVYRLGRVGRPFWRDMVVRAGSALSAAAPERAGEAGSIS